MAAYLIAALTEVVNPTEFDEYRAKVLPVVERFGGRYLAAGAPDMKEGNTRPVIAAVIEFPSMERLQAFYDADDYQDLKALRQRSTRGSLLFLDGFPAG